MKSNEILIALLDTIKAYLGVNNLKQQNIINDFDSPLSSFSSSKDMPNSEEAEWQLKDNLVVIKSKLYVPPGVLRCKAVQLNHNNPLTSYFGYLRTLKLVCQKYYWPDLNRDIKKYVNTYDICYYIKPVRQTLRHIEFFTATLRAFYQFDNGFYYRHTSVQVPRNGL